MLAVSYLKTLPFQAVWQAKGLLYTCPPKADFSVLCHLSSVLRLLAIRCPPFVAQRRRVLSGKILCSLWLKKPPSAERVLFGFTMNANGLLPPASAGPLPVLRSTARGQGAGLDAQSQIQQILPRP
jgi:hypothetical protein